MGAMPICIAPMACQAVLLLAMVATTAGAEEAAPDFKKVSGTFYVVRHGEKIPTGNHLNATGLARAQHLAQLFDGGADSLYTPPKAIFANFFHQEYNSMELATPLARKLGLNINSSYHRPLYGYNNTLVTTAMWQTLAKTGGPVMVVWESWNMVAVVRDLGCNRTWLDRWDGWAWGHLPENEADKYDRFFILTMREGKCAELRMEWEGFRNYETWPGYVPPVDYFALLLKASLFICLALLVAAILLKTVFSWKQKAKRKDTAQVAEPLLGA